MSKEFKLQNHISHDLLNKAHAILSEKHTHDARPLGLVMAAWRLYQDRQSAGTDEEAEVAAVLYGLSWLQDHEAQQALTELVIAVDKAQILIYNPYFYDLKLFLDTGKRSTSVE